MIGVVALYDSAPLPLTLAVIYDRARAVRRDMERRECVCSGRWSPRVDGVHLEDCPARWAAWHALGAARRCWPTVPGRPEGVVPLARREATPVPT